MIAFDKKYLKVVLSISFIVIFLFIILIIPIKNSDISKLTKISNEILTLNASLNKTIQDDNLNSNNKIFEILQNNLKSLNTINSKLQNVQLKRSSSIKIKRILYDYTNLNVELYNSTLNILNNYQTQNFADLYKNLINNEQRILKISNDLSNSSLNISFYKSDSTFFINLNKYINSLYKLNREKDISNSQKSDFLLYINSVFSDFSKLKEDLRPALIKIRQDNRDISILLDDILNKRSTFSKIRNNSFSISVPWDAQNCYMALEEMLNSYEVYLNSFESSVKNEIIFSSQNSNSKNKLIVFNHNNSSDTIDKSYDDAFDKYSSFISSFKELENAVSEYKNK